MAESLKYPGEAYKKKITGKVLGDFMVISPGKGKNVLTHKWVELRLVGEAMLYISSMP